VTRWLREVELDLAKGLTVSNVCRKSGVAGTIYDCWRQRHNPAPVDANRRCRELDDPDFLGSR
jgi:hypothetical protein